MGERTCSPSVLTQRPGLTTGGRGAFSNFRAPSPQPEREPWAAAWSLVQAGLPHLPWTTPWGFLMTPRDATEAASVSPSTYQALQQCPPPSVLGRRKEVRLARQRKC